MALVFIDHNEFKLLYDIFSNYKKFKGVKFDLYYGWREKEQITSTFYAALSDDTTRRVPFDF